MEFLDYLKRLQLVSPGSLVFLLLLVSPIAVWLLHRPDSVKEPLIALAKFNAFMAISSLSFNFVLSVKLRVFERLFLGLDRMYRVHKTLGRATLMFMLLHPLFLGFSKLLETDVLITYVLPIGPLDVALGVIAVYLFLLLLTLTVAINIPYHWWHNSHKVLGLVLIAAGLHAFLAGSDISNYPVLRFWLLVLCSAGVVSWLYMLLLFKHTARRYNVVLSRVDHKKEITEVQFKKPRGFDFQPGQYILLRFPRFEGYKELFPFSISSDPSQGHIRVSIRKSGDYTMNRVPLLRKGDSAVVMGPYGMFGSKYLVHERDMVWIAGGIGVTPFLSMAKHESLNPTGRRILLIWVVKKQEEAFHHEELLAEAGKNPYFTYTLWVSGVKGRMSHLDIAPMLKDKNEIMKRSVFLCGPPDMMYSIAKGLHRLGMPYRHTVFEDFNMLD